MSSGLRQVKKDSIPEEDIEAPKDKASPAKAATAFAAASTSNSFSGGGGSSHNPVFLAKVIFQKVVTLLISSDEEDLTQPGGIITLLKDIILGVILGVLTISTLIFLDHRNIVHFQSAHNFRNAAFQMLNDPETISNLEESSDMKFLTQMEYESKKKEIDSVAEKLKGHEAVLEKRIKEGDAKKGEVESIRAEYKSLMENPLLELSKYNGGGKWGGSSTCDARVQFLQDTYNTRPIAAKISAMGHPGCKKD